MFSQCTRLQSVRTFSFQDEFPQSAKFHSLDYPKFSPRFQQNAQELTTLFSASVLNWFHINLKAELSSKSLNHCLKETQSHPALDWDSLFHCKETCRSAQRIIEFLSSLFSSYKAEVFPTSEATPSVLPTLLRTHLHQGGISLYTRIPWFSKFSVHHCVFTKDLYFLLTKRNSEKNFAFVKKGEK